MEPPLPGHCLPGRAGNITWYLTLASPRPHLPADTSPGNTPPPAPRPPPTMHSVFQVGIALPLQLQATLVQWQGLELEPLTLKAGERG